MSRRMAIHSSDVPNFVATPRPSELAERLRTDHGLPDDASDAQAAAVLRSIGYDSTSGHGQAVIAAHAAHRREHLTGEPF
jgi:hypothetical protein